MIESITLWRTSDEALVLRDVHQWQGKAESLGDSALILRGKLPEKNGLEMRKLLGPSGLFGSGERTVMVWQGQDIKADAWEDWLGRLHNSGNARIHVGISWSSGAVPKAISAYDPEELDYALVTNDAIAWSKDFLSQWCRARFTKDALRQLELTSAGDVQIVLPLTVAVLNQLGERAEDADWIELNEEALDAHLSGVGQVHVFEIKNAVMSGDVERAVEYAMRCSGKDIFPLLSILRKEVCMSALFDSGMEMEEVQQYLGRNRDKEQSEAEKLRRKYAKKGEEVPDEELESLVFYKTSEKQLAYAKRNAPRIGDPALTKLIRLIAETDQQAKSQELNKQGIIGFAACAATLIQIGKKLRKGPK